MAGGNLICFSQVVCSVTILGTSTNSAAKNAVFEVVSPTGQDLRCCSYPVNTTSTPSTIASAIVNCLNPPPSPGDGITVTLSGSNTVVVSSATPPDQCRVCAVANSVGLLLHFDLWREREPRRAEKSTVRPTRLRGHRD